MTRYVPIGHLGMGGAPLGNLFDRVSESDAQATLAGAWGVGIRHFDTAPHYGAGLSEHRFGDALRDRPRSEYTLSTKVGRRLTAVPSVPEQDNGFVGALSFKRDLDYSATGARRSIEDSLQRLGLPSIDVVYIHDVSEDWLGADWKKHFADAMAGAARELTAMRQEGAIKAWGLGVNRVEPCIAALDAADPDLFLVAGRYTLLDHTALDTLFPLCVNKGVHVVIGGPYNSGLLAGGETFNYEKAPADLVARARAIETVCARHGVSLKSAALQFCAAHPVVAAIIPGAKNAAEVTENAAMFERKVPVAVWTELKRDGLIPDHAPTPAD